MLTKPFTVSRLILRLGKLLKIGEVKKGLFFLHTKVLSDVLTSPLVRDRRLMIVSVNGSHSNRKEMLLNMLLKYLDVKQTAAAGVQLQVIYL